MPILQYLSTILGDGKMYIEDDDSDKRSEFGATIEKLLRQGHAIFLVQGNDTRMIRGYDPETNDWIVTSKSTPRPSNLEPPEASLEIPRRGRQRKTSEYVPARGTRAVAVARSAGG